MTSNTFVKNVEHESAIKHVTGRAIYTDDISEPRNLLHAAIGFSPVSKGIIERIDFSEVLNSDGVVDIITETDIKGQNDVGPIFKGDKIFTSKKIEYHGQPIFAVIASSTKLARQALLKVKLKIKKQTPIITIEDAIKKKSFVLKSKTIKKGKSS
ncbi:MAG: xanthine dehydrogenase molybdopterin binding subunit, partial [Nitrosomonadales bacterium]|nr:xanthine dehydrogenase molybdopterin binding subunit [Nitrosomonadales bacterium]